MELAGIPECDDRHAELEARLRKMRQEIAPGWLAQAGKRFDLVLFDYEKYQKIPLIRRHRDRTQNPLWHGKRISELLPSCFMTALTRAEAERERNAYRAGIDMDVELYPTAYDAPAYAVSVAADLPMQVFPATEQYSQEELQENAAGWRRLSDLVGLPVEVLRTTNLRNRTLLLRRAQTFAEAEAIHLAAQPHVRIVWQRLPPIDSLVGAELRWGDTRPYSVVVDHFDPAHRELVKGVLLWHGTFPAEAEELVDRLPVSLAARDLFHAIQIWRRFRGKVAVRFVPRA
jgi:hypothetical protein